MAQGIYEKFYEKIAKGQIDLTSDTIRAIGVDAADYTLDLATHEFLDDVPAGARIGNAGGTGRADGTALANVTVTGRVVDADDLELTGVVGDEFEYLLIYKDDGVADASSPLIAIFDTGTGLPFTPSGGAVQIVWSSGASKVFRL